MSSNAHNGNLSPAEAYRHEVRGYLTGFALAVALTAVPFAMVWMGGFSTVTVIAVIAVLGMIQTAVHVRYFLHVDGSIDHREELNLLLFSLLLLFLMAAGTVWVVVNMNTRMMGM